VSRKAGTFSHVQQMAPGARDAMRAVRPTADRLGVNWREPDNCNDWDTVAGAIFDGLGLEAIRSSNEGAGGRGLVRYDHRVADYAGRSYVAVRRHDKASPLICFDTRAEPFDGGLVAELDAGLQVETTSKLPGVDCQFVAVTSLPASAVIIADKLTWH